MPGLISTSGTLSKSESSLSSCASLLTTGRAAAAGGAAAAGTLTPPSSFSDAPSDSSSSVEYDSSELVEPSSSPQDIRKAIIATTCSGSSTALGGYMSPSGSWIPAAAKSWRKRGLRGVCGLLAALEKILTSLRRIQASVLMSAPDPFREGVDTGLPISNY